MINNGVATEVPGPKAERLFSATQEHPQKSPPKPFGMKYNGPIPVQFTTTPKTTFNLPRHRSFPKNIQDVINSNNFHQSSNFIKTEAPVHDPFHLFKPQDPGEVNLLATGQLRFAPPIWKNLQKKMPVYVPIQQNSNHQEVYNRPKSLALTLNIYPNQERKYKGRQIFQQKFDDGQPPRVKFPDEKPKKMMIHLNLYPDSRESKILQSLLQAPPTDPTN